MIFYKIEAIRSLTDIEEKGVSRLEARSRAAVMAEKSERLFHESHEQAMIFCVSVNSDEIVLGAIFKTKDLLKSQVEQFITMLPFPIESFKAEEITFSAFESLLCCAERNGFITEDETVLKNFEINLLHSRYSSFDFGEAIKMIF